MHLRAVTIGNEEIEFLADALQEYYQLLHLDLAQNRIEGTRGGAAIAKILSRSMKKRGGEDLIYLDLARNALSDGGFAAINHQILVSDAQIETINFAHNGITEIRLFVALDAFQERIYSVINLILDGNDFKYYTYGRLASLMAHATPLESVSFSRCKLGNDGFVMVFEALN